MQKEKVRDMAPGAAPVSRPRVPIQIKSIVKTVGASADAHHLWSPMILSLWPLAASPGPSLEEALSGKRILEGLCEELSFHHPLGVSAPPPSPERGVGEIESGLPPSCALPVVRLRSLERAVSARRRSIRPRDRHRKRKSKARAPLRAAKIETAAKAKIIPFFFT
jgi:hypothetical protein